MLCNSGYPEVGLITWNAQDLGTDTLITTSLVADYSVHSMLQVDLMFAFQSSDHRNQFLSLVAFETRQTETQHRGTHRTTRQRREMRRERFRAGHPILAE